jgi:RAB protein geranylgeranyltransferase component A
LSSPDGKLLQVPNSRNDVFGSDVVNLKEKRLLMKFIQTCSAADTDFLRGACPHATYATLISFFLQDHGSEKFIDYLRAQGLTPNLESFLLYAITLCQTNQTSAGTQLLLLQLLSCVQMPRIC